MQAIIHNPVMLLMGLSGLIALTWVFVAYFKQSTKWERRLLGLLLLLSAGICAGYFWTVFHYLNVPLYVDHDEPEIAANSWYFLHGHPLFHGPNSTELYNFIYGPCLYIITALFELAFGPGILSSKIPGSLVTVALPVCLCFLLVRRASPRVALVATGLFVAILQISTPFVYIVRPEFYIMLAVVLGFWAAQWKSGLAPWILGALVGLSAGFKIHAGVYFLPAFWVAWQQGFRLKQFSTLVLASFVVWIAPYVLLPNVSLLNHLWIIHATTTFKMDLADSLNALGWILMALFPLGYAVGAIYVQNPAHTKQVLAQHAGLMVAIAAELVLLIFPATKWGTGAHYLFPVAIPVVYLGVELFQAGMRYDWHRSLRAACGEAILVAWVFGCFSLGFYRIYGFNAMVDEQRPLAQAVDSDVRHILQTQGQNHILLMGLGGYESYSETYFRVDLVFAGMPMGIDPPVWLHFQHTLAIYHYDPVQILRNLDAMPRPGQSVMWLVPKNSLPFTMFGFDDRFHAAFRQIYHLTASTRYFDLYTDDTSIPQAKSH